MNTNDIIAHSYDEDGNREEISLSDVYHNLIDLVRILYFDYMIRCKDGSFEEFKKVCLHNMGLIVDEIDDVYADHVEGAKLALMPKVNKIIPLEYDSEEIDG